MRDLAEQRLSAGTLDDFAERLKRRRTISDFKPLPVARELLLKAVDVARWAPNHRLSEPWRFYLAGPETTDRLLHLIVETKMGDRDEAARAAMLKRLDRIPGWFVVSCRRNDDAVREREDYAACCCAIQNLSLYLWQAGVGLKWTSGAVTRDERCLRLFGIEPGEQFIVGLFQYGYPEKVPEQRRKTVDEICLQLD